MNPDQSQQPSTRFIDLRNQLQDVKSLLYSVASAGGMEDEARDNLDIAIRSIQSVSEELAAVCGGQLEGPERTFQESRTREAKSEVDSGEFDVHG